MRRKKIYIAVTNDLIGDQRVHKVSTTLHRDIGDVTLIGARFGSKDVLDRDYKTIRLGMIFKRSVLFYLEYNIRLFLFLLFRKQDLIVANDLDTLLAAYCASKMKFKTHLVYDSHEYFTEVPELIGRRFVRGVWLSIEKLILPKITNAYTVCDSIAKMYEEKYGLEMGVVRNVPYQKEYPVDIKRENTILYQGALNVGRGLEEAVLAMKFVNNAKLLIIGDGDIAQDIRQLIEREALGEKVEIKGKIPFQELFPITCTARLGLCIDRGGEMGLSYYYSLPNRLFDYIQARVPILFSNLPEIMNVNSHYKVGYALKSYSSKILAKQISDILEDQDEEITENLKRASQELCWENEEAHLLKVYANLV